jgi:hypothetical protein
LIKLWIVRGPARRRRRRRRSRREAPLGSSARRTRGRVDAVVGAARPLRQRIWPRGRPANRRRCRMRCSRGAPISTPGNFCRPRSNCSLSSPIRLREAHRARRCAAC